MPSQSITLASILNTQFSILELLLFLGVAQCVVILVYIMFRSGDACKAALPFLYFFLLGAAFFIDFSGKVVELLWPYYSILQSFLWFSAPVICPLVLIQVIQVTKVPKLQYFSIIFFPLIAFFVSVYLGKNIDGCDTILTCPFFSDWMIVSFIVAAELSFIVLWLERTLFKELQGDKHGKERYWVVLMMIIFNLALIFVMVGNFRQVLSIEELHFIRTLLGLGLIYLVMTSLFRIYPQPVRLLLKEEREHELNEDEIELALRVEDLLNLDKIYHESGYNRTDLAQELGASEVVLSKVINLHFQKSLPQLLNEFRVKDAQQLLLETNAAVKIVGDEVGFNSLATFNRVFKDIAGMSPTEYRKNKIK